jgi:hypothetical protein
MSLPSRPPCVPRSRQKKQTSTEIFFSAGQSGVRSCTVISRRHPNVKQKKVIVRSGPLSVEVLFLGRDIGQLGQGCPSPPDPQVYRGPCKKTNFDRDSFLRWSVGPGGAVVNGNFAQAPHCKTKKGHCTVWPTLGRSFISRQGPRSVGTGMTPPSRPPCVSLEASGY